MDNTIPVAIILLAAAYAADRIEALESTLKDIEDYLAGIADCDMDQDGHVPNDEMRLLVQVRAALYGEDKP